MFVDIVSFTDAHSVRSGISISLLRSENGICRLFYKHIAPTERRQLSRINETVSGSERLTDSETGSKLLACNVIL